MSLVIIVASEIFSTSASGVVIGDTQVGATVQSDFAARRVGISCCGSSENVNQTISDNLTTKPLPGLFRNSNVLGELKNGPCRI